ncbi:type IV toxin-antitoxin system AbiEi family antitoxin [Frigoribacterium sp. VKM Ac-2836]|uniref:type IV toxin-antitoxin system AbiEi family antitoxin n=1 Tax=Frigoribacterium sp. VKM Ac-2836 TaxID=2739014 RepID=UPI0015660FE7|nr:type IV toxin-antitoxin system AbiEi family antitoxin [Frigoribacterium sp. VKM Ac-2836]NRD25949.1 hypothetical protein [Frigoribacterium sp. VKM Ac-2836]
MPERLPAVLTTDDLPEAELRAAALDGQVYAVGDSWRSVAEIDDHVGRAISVGLTLGAGVVAAERTAAWVWGARGSAPLPHFGLVVSPARVKHRGRGSVVRQVVIDDDEIVQVNGAAVTTPARTVVDLARREGWASMDETAARDVASRHGVTASEAVAVLDRRGRLPHRPRTLDRIARVCVP